MRRKTLVEWLTVTLLAGLLAVFAGQQQWLWRFDTLVYDSLLNLAATEPARDVIVVAIDDRSLSEVGRWPWSRAVHAALLERLQAQGAAVVVFDVILHEQSSAAADAALAAAMRAHGAVVLPVTHGLHAARSDGEALPTEAFRSAAAALGHIHIELDPDGIARSLYLWEGMNRPTHPQLALAALSLVLPERAADYPPPQRSAGAGWQRADWFRIPFAGPPGTYRHVSYVDVLRGDVPEGLLDGAVVFVGTSAVGMGDMVPSPTSGHGGLMPGVEIHATVFDALRRGAEIRAVPASLASGVNLAAVLVLMVLLLRCRPGAAMLATFGMLLTLLASSALLMHLAGLWLAVAPCVAACLLAYPLWSWRRLEASFHYFERELDALRKLGAAPESTGAGRGAPDPLVERIEVIQRAARQQRDLQRSREQTMHFLSHDLRAPLASILTVLQSDADARPGCGGRDQGRHGEDAGAQDGLRVRIERHARSALNMADNLLRLARAENADPAGFVDVSLELVAQEALDEIWAQANAREQRIGYKTDLPMVQGEEVACFVRGDAELLRRALVNLLGNAVKYTPKGGEIDLTLEGDGQQWAVRVRDNGPGIAPAQQARLFQRFARVQDEANRSIDGIGLGLLMVRTVAERHGGRVGLDSEPGRGSVFSLYLPAAPAEGSTR